MGLGKILKKNNDATTTTPAYEDYQGAKNQYKNLYDQVFSKFKKISVEQEDNGRDQAVDQDGKFEEIKNKWSGVEANMEEISEYTVSLEIVTRSVYVTRHGERRVTDSSYDNMHRNLHKETSFYKRSIDTYNSEIFELQGKKGEAAQIMIDKKKEHKLRCERELERLEEISRYLEENPDLVWVKLRHIIEKAISGLKAIEILIDEYFTPDDEELMARKRNLLESLEHNTLGAREVFEEIEL